MNTLPPGRSTRKISRTTRSGRGNVRKHYCNRENRLESIVCEGERVSVTEYVRVSKNRVSSSTTFAELSRVPPALKFKTTPVESRTISIAADGSARLNSRPENAACRWVPRKRSGGHSAHASGVLHSPFPNSQQRLHSNDRRFWTAEEGYCATQSCAFYTEAGLGSHRIHPPQRRFRRPGMSRSHRFTEGATIMLIERLRRRRHIQPRMLRSDL